MGDVTTNPLGGPPARPVRTAPIAVRQPSPLSKKVLLSDPLLVQFSRRFAKGL
jgi:hypothetical protein